MADSKLKPKPEATEEAEAGVRGERNGMHSGGLVEFLKIVGLGRGGCAGGLNALDSARRCVLALVGAESKGLESWVRILGRRVGPRWRIGEVSAGVSTWKSMESGDEWVDQKLEPEALRV